ncbi:MAG: hypothetical protein B6D59_00335 [Campylobacteraceae bacterium 4484_4]|nr:MAG: hypothetical protein B6D59_00335 [Campylobacteraceae bacterium 4484_4]
MTITIYSIEKQQRDIYTPVLEHFEKMIGRYARIVQRPIQTNQIVKAQQRGEHEAQRAYTAAFNPYLKGYNVALHPEGKLVDSLEFSENFAINSALNFFIGGAYGFEPSFLRRMDRVISLGRVTMGHKIAKVVLFEQIYRGLTIREGHPYHK